MARRVFISLSVFFNESHFGRRTSGLASERHPIGHKLWRVAVFPFPQSILRILSATPKGQDPAARKDNILNG